MENESLALKAQVEERLENQPPVAGLQYVIMNPDSLLNGQITTNTQNAWLWSYNEKNHTYDPDGDKITNRMINGISNADIVGSLTGDIGFVTQFKTAAQYEMTYQVQDEHGAISNIVKFNINVEPKDGHARPKCVLGVSTTTPRLNEVMRLDYSNSKDYQGNAIRDVRGIVFDPNGNSKSISDYIVKIDGVPQFDRNGAYYIPNIWKLRG